VIVLGIDTATAVCSVGLSGDNGFIADYRLNRLYGHAEVLPSAVERILNDTGLEGDGLDGIAVSIGPGSFTGLRIGMGMGKGLALGWEKPLIAVPTMEAWIARIPGVCEWACVVIPSRKGEIYRSLFHYTETDWVPEGETAVVLEKDIGQGLPEGDLVLLGLAPSHYREYLDKRSRVILLDVSETVSSGYAVAEFGRLRLAEGKLTEWDMMTPLYIKRFQGVA
jgi:tRNA threonylcarbamoyladenosine biosynthesis protein TsaB